MRRRLIVVTCAVVLIVGLMSIVGYAEEPKKKPKKGELNDALWVEIKAHEIILSGKIPDAALTKKEAFAALQKELEALYPKFGVTKKEVKAYTEKLMKKDVKQFGMLSQQAMKRAEEIAKKEEKPKPEPKHIKYLPDVPLFPGSKFNEESTKETIWYETKASQKEVFSFYKEKLTKADWKCNATKFSLYFIKGDKAFELSMPGGEGSIQYRPLSAKKAIAESVDLNKDDYIAKVVSFAEKLAPYLRKHMKAVKQFQSNPSPENSKKMEKAEQEVDKAVDKIGPEVGVTLGRLKSFNKKYAIDLMNYLEKHTELKKKGVPKFLGLKLEYWNALGSSIEDYLKKNPKEQEKLMKQYQKFAGSDWVVAGW